MVSARTKNTSPQLTTAHRLVGKCFCFHGNSNTVCELIGGYHPVIEHMFSMYMASALKGVQAAADSYEICFPIYTLHIPHIYIMPLI